MARGGVCVVLREVRYTHTRAGQRTESLKRLRRCAAPPTPPQEGDVSCARLRLGEC